MIQWISYEQGKEMVRVVCPHCGELLNSTDDERECRVKVKSGNREGSLYISAFWGDYASREEGLEISKGDIVEMFCPHCDKSLASDGLCKECESTTTIFGFSDGFVGICNRKGCRMHLRSSEASISHDSLLRLRVEGWDGPYKPF